MPKLLILLCVALFPLTSHALTDAEVTEEPDIYGLVVGYTIDEDGALLDYRIADFVDPHDRDRRFTLTLSNQALTTLGELLAAAKFPPSLKDGKPDEQYAPYFYAPALPALVFSNPEVARAELLENNIRNFDIRTVEALGRRIYEKDIVAANATDAIFESGFDTTEHNVQGWVVTGKPKRFRVVFIGKNGDALVEVFEVLFRGTKVKRAHTLNNRVPSPETLARFNARTLVLQHIETACSEKYNTVVLDDPDGDGFLVYALSSTTNPNIIPVGGHYRFTVDAKGETIKRKDRLFKSCLILPKNAKKTKDGHNAVGLFMTHIISPTPVETHVFLSLLHEKMFVVRTPDDQDWKIEKGKIEKTQVMEK